MFKRKSAVEGYTKEGWVWVEIKWGVKNRTKKLSTDIYALCPLQDLRKAYLRLRHANYYSIAL